MQFNSMRIDIGKQSACELLRLILLLVSVVIRHLCSRNRCISVQTRRSVVVMSWAQQSPQQRNTWHAYRLPAGSGDTNAKWLLQKQTTSTVSRLDCGNYTSQWRYTLQRLFLPASRCYVSFAELTVELPYFLHWGWAKRGT